MKLMCDRSTQRSLGRSNFVQEIRKQKQITSGASTVAATVCDSIPSIQVGGSGGMLPQKILKIRVSEVHCGDHLQVK